MEIGDKYGRLKVIATGLRLPREGRSLGYPAVKCLCDCGNTHIVQIRDVLEGSCQSCGCLNRETRSRLTRIRNTKHGMSKTPEYVTWLHMVSRCQIASDKNYKDYGGRGITVHPDWLGEGGFERFYAHVGPRPTPKHSIDRFPDNNGNYEPGNVRWATGSQQRLNTRKTVKVVYKGKEWLASELAVTAGIRPKTFLQRLRSGWSVDRAVNTPVQQPRQGRK